MNEGLIILICVILLGVIMYFLIDYSDSEFAKKRKFKKNFPYSTENGYEENSMVKYRIKNYVEKTIKPKMHLSNYGFVVCSVLQKTLSTKIKIFIPKTIKFLAYIEEYKPLVIDEQ